MYQKFYINIYIYKYFLHTLLIFPSISPNIYTAKTRYTPINMIILQFKILIYLILKRNATFLKDNKLYKLNLS